MILMDVKYLNYVLTIASEHNLHRAAEKLYISQPSLSQFLTKLEAEIGTPLFERRSKDLVLTEAGRLYVETAQTVVGLRNKLYRDISNLIYQNHLSIATTSQWGMRLISQVLPAFNQNHPDVMVEITESFFPSMARRLQNCKIFKADGNLVAIFYHPVNTQTIYTDRSLRRREFISRRFS